MWYLWYPLLCVWYSLCVVPPVLLFAEATAYHVVLGGPDPPGPGMIPVYSIFIITAPAAALVATSSAKEFQFTD